MLNRNGESRHPCLPNFRKAFSLLPLSLILAVDFVLFCFSCPLSGWGSSLLFLVCRVFLSWRSVRFCPLFFLHILRWPCGICPLFYDMVYCINWFLDVIVETVIHSWDKSHFVMMYNPVYTLLDLVLLGKFFWALSSKLFTWINSFSFQTLWRRNYFFLKDFIYVFEREREGETAWAGRGDHDLSRRWSLNQLSHPGAPDVGTIIIPHIRDEEDEAQKHDANFPRSHSQQSGSQDSN